MKKPLNPKVAIVIPVFKHSVFLAEAIEAAIAQEAPFDIVTVVVDDGCPFPETTAVGASYAMARRDVFFLRKANGGLSSARNFGIDFALARFPGIEAIYLLDADNRITPNAIATAFATLRENPDADWVYPNIDKFGAHWNGNFTPPYSRLLHIMFDNICEAGSLASRRMFDAGCRFDESMKAGMEDWDFWLQGLGKGMKGVNAPFFGFEYRLRGESMLSDTDREREGVMAYLQKKHRDLFAIRNLTALEHRESPRYALVDTPTLEARLFVDPALPGRTLDFEAYLRLISASSAEPDHYGAPDYLIWLPEPAMAALTRVGIASTALRALENHIGESNFIALRLKAHPDRYALSLRRIGTDHPLAEGVHGWFTRQGIFRECVLDPSIKWVATLNSPAPLPRVAELVIEAPFDAADLALPFRDATSSLLSGIALAKEDGLIPAHSRRWNWREAYFPSVRNRHEMVRSKLRTGPLQPHCYDGKRVQIGMAVPIASFGGVEKVAFALAKVLAAAGCDLHLFSMGAPQVALQAGQPYPFKTTNFLFDEYYALWGGSRSFMGHELRMENEAAAKSADVVGMLAGLDVLIASQVAPLNAVIGRLRRLGVKILNHVHVIDETPAGRTAGHPYLALGFEHAYDAILTCSEALKAWLHGMGAPREKLVVLNNAPGYAMSPAQLSRALARRAAPGAEEPIRAVFLGRLDEQKGVDRLVAAISATKASGARVEWRVIGSAIINDAWGGDHWGRQLKDLGVALEPPIFDSEALTEIYLASDILALTSRWEGAPLSIIEAQRLGCIPVATDVGAVRELIDDGVDGFLLPETGDDAIAAALVRRIDDLDRDRALLARVRDAAIRRAAAADWTTNAAPVLDLLESWFPGRVGAAEGAADGQMGALDDAPAILEEAY